MAKRKKASSKRPSANGERRRKEKPAPRRSITTSPTDMAKIRTAEPVELKMRDAGKTPTVALPATVFTVRPADLARLGPEDAVLESQICRPGSACYTDQRSHFTVPASSTSRAVSSTVRQNPSDVMRTRQRHGKTGVGGRGGKESPRLIFVA
jgi:hypothetical protein